MVEGDLSGIITFSQWVMSSANTLNGNDKNIFALSIHVDIFLSVSIFNKYLILVFLPHIQKKDSCFIINLSLVLINQIISKN